MLSMDSMRCILTTGGKPRARVARGRFPIPFRRSLLYHWFVAAESRREGSDDMAEQRHNSGIVKAEQPAVQADDTRRRAARRKTSLPFALPRAS